MDECERDKCERCEKEVEGGLHTCPHDLEFLEEGEEPIECNCCEACAHECAMDI